MILSHIKQSLNLKTEDGEYYIDLFSSNREGLRPELREKKIENKREIVLRLTESIYFDMDPYYPYYEEKIDNKSIEKSQIIYEKGKIPNSQQLQMMMRNFVDSFKTKEQIYWSLEILGSVFLFNGDELINKNTNSNNPVNIISVYPEKVYEKGLEIYRVLLLLLAKIGIRESDNQSILKIENGVLPVKLILEEEDKQKLFRLAISHLSLSFEKIENLKKPDFLLRVIDVFNRCIILNPIIIKDDTWEFILFVLMGILDFIIQKSKKIEPKVLEELQHQLIMSLMNAWINSGMRDCALWKKFSYYARNWQSVDLFLNKWKEVCFGLTRKVLRDLYKLPFIKVKLEINSAKDNKNGFDTSSKKDYAAKASSFLLIVYEKLKSERSESQTNFNVNIHSKNQIFSENNESNQHLFWANISSEHAVFLWHKFLHLFERHPCEPIPFPSLLTIKFSSLLLKTIQEIVNEILKVGHGISSQKLKDLVKENKDFYLSLKSIETIWCKPIQPRRKDKTQCFDCMKKFNNNKFKSLELQSPLFFEKSPEKSSNSDHEKTSIKIQANSEDLGHVKNPNIQLGIGNNSNINMNFNSNPNIISNNNTNQNLNIESKKEMFEKELKKKTYHKQMSMGKYLIKEKLGLAKSSTKDPILKAKAQSNNKYMFCKHKVPKGDDILSVFSKWLFECGSTNIAGHEDLNLLAIQILGKIFRKARGPFKEEYLLKFYCLLTENIKKEESSGYLKICVKLFEVNLPNNYCLMKDFMQKYHDYSFKIQPIKFLDIYCKYISHFVCVYLGRLKYVEEFESKLEYYYSLDYWVNHIIECLKIWEKKEKNKTTCLKIVNWVFSVHTVNKGKFHSIIKKIFSACKDNFKQNRLSSLKLMNLCFNIMLSVGEIYHLEKLKNEDGLERDQLADIKSSVDILFEELDLFLKKFEIKTRLSKGDSNSMKDKDSLDKDKDKEKESEVIVNISFLILQCVYVWLTLPLAEINENIYNFAVSLFLETFQNTTFKRLNEYSSLILRNLMNNMGKSLNFQNTILLSTAISSIEEPESMNPNQMKISIFDSFKDSQSVVINQDVIITFYLGDLSPNEDLILCIRNNQGKFIWQGELIYKLFPNKDYEPFTDFETFPYKTNAEIYENLRYYWKNEEEEGAKSKRVSGVSDGTSFNKPLLSLNEVTLEETNKYEDGNDEEGSDKSADIEKKLFGLTIDDMIEREFQLEEEYEKDLEDKRRKKECKKTDYAGQSAFIKKQIEINSLNETRLLNITKLFLFHFGFLDIRNTTEMANKAIFLENTKDLWDSLKDLDKASERSQIEVFCFFIDSLYQTELNVPIFDEKNYREYTEFIDSISCFLDETSYKTGMYESVKHFQRKYQNINYSSNMLYEIIYLQPQLHEKMFKNMNICILWNARANNDKFDNKLPSFLKLFLDDIPKNFIMITPLNPYLFTIKVFKVTEINEIKDIYVGPLISQMIITKESLPTLVNATILNISRKSNPTPLLESQELRKLKIEKIIEKYMNKEKTENFLSILNLSNVLNREIYEKRDSGSCMKNEVFLKSPSDKFQVKNMIIEENKQNEETIKNTEKIDRVIETEGKSDQFEFMIKEDLEEFSNKT